MTARFGLRSGLSGLSAFSAWYASSDDTMAGLAVGAGGKPSPARAVAIFITHPWGLLLTGTKP